MMGCERAKVGDVHGCTSVGGAMDGQEPTCRQDAGSVGEARMARSRRSSPVYPEITLPAVFPFNFILPASFDTHYWNRSPSRKQVGWGISRSMGCERAKVGDRQEAGSVGGARMARSRRSSPVYPDSDSRIPAKPPPQS